MVWLDSWFSVVVTLRYTWYTKHKILQKIWKINITYINNSESVYEQFIWKFGRIYLMQYTCIILYTVLLISYYFIWKYEIWILGENCHLNKRFDAPLLHLFLCPFMSQIILASMQLIKSQLIYPLDIHPF